MQIRVGGWVFADAREAHTREVLVPSWRFTFPIQNDEWFCEGKCDADRVLSEYNKIVLILRHSNRRCG